MQRTCRALSFFCLFLAAAHAGAQPWPSKPVRFIVPFPPGGSTDVAARVLSEHLSRAFGQRFVVENKGGGGGAVGTAEAARAKPDGYTVLFGANAITLLHLATKNLPYDTLRDFSAVTQVTTQPNALAVNPSIPVSNVRELIAYVQANPGKLSYAHPGEGTSQHLAAEQLWKLAVIKVNGIPYRGGGQAITDLVGGHVQIAVIGSTPLIPQHKAGRVKIIAFMSKGRFDQLPDVPTLAEAGFDIESTQWLGLLVPRGTPADIVKRLQGETSKALALPEVKEQLARAALTPVGSTPEEFAALIRNEIESWGGVAQSLAISPQ
jgi:tripartite-type tricarboxylate transporter receptor subunit TctC